MTSLADADDSKNLIVAPRDDLPDDTAFSVVAWNKVANCGSNITPAQAAAITSGFVESFARVYTPAVLVLAVLVAVAPPLLGLGTLADWTYRALVLHDQPSLVAGGDVYRLLL